MELRYDSPEALFDIWLLYDSVSSPQLTTKHMSKVKLGLQKLPPDDVVALATTIITAMTGNANFATPNPTLASFTTLKAALATKIAAHNSALAAAATALSDRDTALAELKRMCDELLTNPLIEDFEVVVHG